MNFVQSIENKSSIDKDDDYNKISKDEKFSTNGIIRVDLKECIVYFKPGHKFTHKIKLLNVTDSPQIVQIESQENKIFKFPNRVTIPPNGSWKLPITIMSRSNEEFKRFLYLKNSTGQEILAIELTIIPKTNSCSLPRTIHFGNVDIGLSVTRKLCLTPESNPYQFRIFIPYSLEGLSVNPTCGEVLCDSTTDVKIVYTPQSYITLCIDLLLYFSNDNQNPRIVTLTAVTKPNTNSIKHIKTNKMIKKEINYPVCHITRHRNKTNEDDIKVFNRMTLNKMLMNKDDSTVNYNTWKNSLGELDNLYRKSYMQDCKNFVECANQFGDTHKKLQLKIPKCEMKYTDDKIKHIIEKRLFELNTYKDKLNSYQSILKNKGMSESLGFRERSIRMNYIEKNEYNFDSYLDDNWWIRFQTYKKFVNAVNVIIIKNRLKKKLAIFKTLMIK